MIIVGRRCNYTCMYILIGMIVKDNDEKNAFQFSITKSIFTIFTSLKIKVLRKMKNANFKLIQSLP
jgi:hypothetical protein